MMADYYRKRASEYDALYECTELRSDLAVLKDWLVAHASGRTLLEVAAGTGYWTAVAAPVAKAITATDINAETLAIAAERKLGEHIALVQADAWCPPNTRGGLTREWHICGGHISGSRTGPVSVAFRFVSGARNASDDRSKPRRDGRTDLCDGTVTAILSDTLARQRRATEAVKTIRIRRTGTVPCPSVR
jgi:SAM-dependent methyltransferase